MKGALSMRRINESIESLTPVATAGPAPDAPLAFRWRGRRYVVGSVLEHWVETGAWWRHIDLRGRVMPPADDSADDPAENPPPDPERWIWRVEADSRGRQSGVFDVCLDRDRERWFLAAIYD
jgi:hypothetical protein